ncbi:methyltransferase [Litorivivens sp.]|uniref:methyltransferase n=1 Tax=Litorivivens sp. TaxID=2020868 RepID=UPI00356A9BF0
MAHYRTQFLALDALLHSHRDYWQCQPFVSTPPWANDVAFLDEVGDDAIADAQANDDALLELFHRHFPTLCNDISRLTDIAKFEPAQTTPAPRFVPGRKWQQIERFALALSPLYQPTLEWCCGKGHLSRYLYQLSQREARGLEIDTALIEAGNQLAQQELKPVRLKKVDVLDASARSEIAPDDHVVALHACGGLHRKLLTDATQQRAQRISYSPCCYHKFQVDFRPLSTLAQNSALTLQLADLRTAVRQNTTAGRAERQRHQQQQCWRLGFDALQRELRHSDTYLPTPPVPTKALKGNFSDYCKLLAAHKGLTLPPGLDFAGYEKRGTERYHSVSRQELMRALFRRPLELWLLLDQVLHLQEFGYCCTVRRFCPPHMTPRNLLIDAHLA